MAPKIRTLGSSIEQIKILNSEFAMIFVYLRYYYIINNENDHRWKSQKPIAQATQEQYIITWIDVILCCEMYMEGRVNCTSLTNTDSRSIESTPETACGYWTQY